MLIIESCKSSSNEKSILFKSLCSKLIVRKKYCQIFKFKEFENNLYCFVCLNYVHFEKSLIEISERSKNHPDLINETNKSLRSVHIRFI
jgi:hypothetical protein